MRTQTQRDTVRAFLSWRLLKNSFQCDIKRQDLYLTSEKNSGSKPFLFVFTTEILVDTKIYFCIIWNFLFRKWTDFNKMNKICQVLLDFTWNLAPKQARSFLGFSLTFPKRVTNPDIPKQTCIFRYSIRNFVESILWVPWLQSTHLRHESEAESLLFTIAECMVHLVHTGEEPQPTLANCSKHGKEDEVRGVIPFDWACSSLRTSIRVYSRLYIK